MDRTPNQPVGVLIRTDGFTQKSDIISLATLRTMWTSSTANPGYGKGRIVAPTWRGHNGAMEGTISYLVRRNDGFGFAVTVNEKPADNSFAGELKGVIDGFIDTVGACPS
jgi:hypothetical protein